MNKLPLLIAMAVAAPLAAAQGNNLKAGQPTPDFTLRRVDQSSVTKNELMNEGPFFLYFVNVRDNVSAQTTEFLVRHLKQYGDMKVKFRAVINGTTDVARAYDAEKRTDMDLLLDPNANVATLFGLRSAPAIVLIDTKGNAVRAWQGLSGAKMKDLNKWIARQNGVKAKPVNTRLLPNSTRYGATFQRGVGSGTGGGS